MSFYGRWISTKHSLRHDSLLQFPLQKYEPYRAVDQELRRYAEEDHVYQRLLHYIREGFPDLWSQLLDDCRVFQLGHPKPIVSGRWPNCIWLPAIDSLQVASPSPDTAT